MLLTYLFFNTISFSTVSLQTADANWLQKATSNIPNWQVRILVLACKGKLVQSVSMSSWFVYIYADKVGHLKVIEVGTSKEIAHLNKSLTHSHLEWIVL